jgi:hypothetical protein
VNAGVFASVFAALFVAHQVADHWVQTQHQADNKGRPCWPGRAACLAHVATYTATAAVFCAGLFTVTGWRPAAADFVAGLAVSAVSHYVADRRTPLRRVALALGKDPRWLDNGGGLYALDQSFHYAWLFIAALIIA